MNGVLRVLREQPVAVRAVLRVVERARCAGRKLARFDTAMLLSTPGVKSFSEIKDGTVVVDYRDVVLKGYLSTFGGVDRQGDTVKAGAFSEAIGTFMRNPVLLRDHRNSIEDVVGKFVVVREDGNGLYVEAKLSESPGEVAKDTRWKVAEGTLGALSMGGYFHYEQDGRTIYKVDLYEGSIVAIPANQDALFTVRDVSSSESKELGRR